MLRENAVTDLHELLRARAKAQPTTAALLWDADAQCSYAELLEIVERLLAQLNAAGFGRNDRIAVALPQGPEMALTCLALMVGASCAPLNPDYTRDDFDYLLAELDVKCLITAPGFQPQATAAAAALGLAVIEVRQAAGSIEWWREDASTGPAEPLARGCHEDIALVLHTSGSTARPKIVPLTQQNLLASAQNLTASLALGPDDRCLSMMPLFHVGALVDLLLAPLWAGGSVILTRAISNESFLAMARSRSPTWYQAVPTILRAIIDAGAEFPRSGLRLVRSVSSPLPVELSQRAEAYFAAPVIEIYGMTETAGLISSNPLPPQPRKPGSVGVAVGPELAVVDELGNLAAVGKAGEVIVRGDNVMAGYEGSERGDAFLNGWLRTGDQGYLDAEGYLYLTGRIKDIINRGGEKIAPREIDELMANYPGVEEAAAFATAHDTLGEEVAAAVVVGDRAGWSEPDFLAYLAAHLAYFKVPRRVFYPASLPRGAGGKLQRYQLQHLCDEVAAAALVEYRPPATPLARALVGMWQSALRHQRIGIDDNFFDLGGDSLSAATFIAELEHQFGQSVHAAALFDNPTVAGFEDYLNQCGLASEAEPEFLPSGLPQAVYRDLVANTAAWRGQRADRDSLLVGQNTLGSRPPIYMCWNGALDSAAAFMGPEQPVYCMRDLWGLPSRSESNNELLAEHYAREIERVHAGGQLVLGGFCEGGKLAFEIASRLRERGQEVALLFLIEQFVPAFYEAPVALFFSDHGRMSAFHHYARPRLGWHKYYTGALTADVGSWEHEQFVEGDNIEPLLAQIMPRLERALAGKAGASTAPVGLQLLSGNDYQATLRCRSPRYFSVLRPLKCQLTVTNKSCTTWQPSDSSGICVSGRWRRWGLKKVHPGPVAGTSLLHQALEPGNNVSLELVLRPPLRPGIWILEVDLVEQGVTWFGDKIGSAVRTTVVVNAPLRAWLRSIQTWVSAKVGQ